MKFNNFEIEIIDNLKFENYKNFFVLVVEIKIKNVSRETFINFNEFVSLFCIYDNEIKIEDLEEKNIKKIYSGYFTKNNIKGYLTFKKLESSTLRPKFFYKGKIIKVKNKIKKGGKNA